MSGEQDQLGQRTSRRSSRFSEIFLEHIGRRELRYPRCRTTGAVLGYTSRQCADHPMDLIEWVEATGRATLRSFVIYHQAYSPEFRTPYNVAVVELEEGPTLVSTVLVENLVDLRVRMPLRAVFEADGRLAFVPS